ncbi:hypothetical protein G5V58_18345 [Nocardioides anomalus]|uniref:Uncharacterized protein n=1 Tax=Nocardioides anomalus TaxID=2712223 RepID=A0A6G6WGX5_9ACTN|nr:hypothetical protein [Nocardioides anomalus]QIG44482.1 hypothetical protein G5V58_18345 [Nocardioides anomalus]
MTWFGDVPNEVIVAGTRFWLAQAALEEADPGAYFYGPAGERPSTDWPAMTLFTMARLQLDEMVQILEKEFDISAAAFAGEEVSRRLSLAIAAAGSLSDEEDVAFEIACVGEAVDLWRALHHDGDRGVGHAFAVDGTISFTSGPELPELKAVGVRASEGGELNTSPA